MGGTVVITGCSTGIGKACARRLSSHGFEVFAGVRREEDASRLVSFATPVVLDVASTESVEQAAAFVTERAHSPLVGLVNNAGTSLPAPLELVDLEDVQRVLEVNLFGPLRMVQALIDGLRASHGRIVNIGSGEAFLTTPMNGPYCMSKHALEALSEGLRLELGAAGIPVVVVEPGLTDTAILEKGRSHYASLPSRFDAGDLARYQDLVDARAAMSARKGAPADRVAKVVQRALTARRPRARYFAGSDVRGAYLLGRIAPRRLRDLIFTRVLGFPRLTP